MERNDWKNLNGPWKYAITKKGDPTPAAYQGDILVPFAVESSLCLLQSLLADDTL